MKIDTSVPFVALKLVPEYFDHATVGIVRSLGRLGVDTIAFHDAPHAPAASSRYSRRRCIWNAEADPGFDPVDLLRKLSDWIDGRAVMLATDDVSSTVLSEHAATLSEWYVFPEQPPGLAQSLYDKRGMAEICERLDIPTPGNVFPRDRDEVMRFAEDATYPIVLKAIDSWRLQADTGTRMAIVEDRHSLLEEYDRLASADPENLMLQEYIPGGAESVWMLDGYYNADSDCLFAVTGRKLRQFPPYTGMTSLGVCVPNPEVERLTQRLAKEIGYRGVLDLGYRFDARDGQYKLLDVNPRVGASLRLFVGDGGMDAVRAAYLDLSGQEVPRSKTQPGRRWVVENLDLVSSRRYLRDGSLTAGSWLASFRGVREAAWFALDDPLPFVSMAWRFGVMKARGTANRGRFGAS